MVSAARTVHHPMPYAHPHSEPGHVCPVCGLDAPPCPPRSRARRQAAAAPLYFGSSQPMQHVKVMGPQFHHLVTLLSDSSSEPPK